MAYFQSDKELGDVAEKIFEKVLSAAGYHYIPLCTASESGAPMLLGKSKIVLPDFEIFGDVGAFYVDVKGKTSSVFYRNGNELRHGIDRDKYEQYRAMGLTGFRNVGVAFLELTNGQTGEWSGALRLGMFDVIGSPARGFSTQAHMVYWPVRILTILGTLTLDELKTQSVRFNGKALLDRALARAAVHSPTKAKKQCDDCWEIRSGKWIEEECRYQGRLKVTCRMCGRFIGYKFKDDNRGRRELHEDDE